MVSQASPLMVLIHLPIPQMIPAIYLAGMINVRIKILNSHLLFIAHAINVKFGAVNLN